MNSNPVLSLSQRATRLLKPNKSGYTIGILAVFVPFVTLGLIGGALGTDTSFASAFVITLAYLLAVVVATVVLKSQGSGWGEIGLARPKSWPKTIFLALGALLSMIVVIILFQIVLANIPGLAMPASDQSDYNSLVGNVPLLLLMIVAAWTSVAFGEEMVFRAFLTVSLVGALGDTKVKSALAVIISSIMFGMAHYDWGLAGMIDTFLMGLVFGAFYLRTDRNLWVPIIAHGLINTLKFSLVFAGLI